MNYISNALIALLIPTATVMAQGKGRAFVYQLTVTATNNGDNCTSPLWFGIHTGNFDIFDGSNQAEKVLDKIIDDSNFNTLTRLFEETPNVLINGIVGDEDICPGERISSTAMVKVGGPRRKTKFYFSFVTAAGSEAFGNEAPQDTLIFRPKFQEDNFPVRGGDLRIGVEAMKTKNRARAKLNGRNVVPPVKSKKGGAVTFKIDNNRESFALNYRIKITRAGPLENITAIALVVGKDELLDFLTDFDGDISVNNKGILEIKGGVIEEGSLSITNEELWDAMYNDEASVVLKTNGYPDGESTGFFSIAKPEEKAKKERTPKGEPAMEPSTEATLAPTAEE